MKQHYPSSTREVTATLKSHGISPTRQRVELGRLILSRPQHLTADALYDMARARNAPVSRATVYNTLRLFSGQGLLNEVVIDANAKYFDSNLQPHQHLFNTTTGELTDLDSNKLSVTGIPKLPRNAHIEGIDIVIRYSDAAER